MKVWFDDYSLGVGDSLRASIERGLRECKGCVVILTPNFLENRGWTKKEFDSAFTREIVEDLRVIFPIWAGVGSRDVFGYSPTFADRVGADWNKGLAHVAASIVRAIERADQNRIAQYIDHNLIS